MNELGSDLGKNLLIEFDLIHFYPFGSMYTSVLSLVTIAAAIAAGGALGGVARVWVSSRVMNRLGQRFPWGTLAVNVSGATVIGGFVAFLHGQDWSGNAVWLMAVVGVLGSYTTVSSFSLETLALMQKGKWSHAFAYIMASVFLCIASAATSFLLIRHWIE